MNNFSEEYLMIIIKDLLIKKRSSIKFDSWKKMDSSSDPNDSYDFLLNGDTIVEITKVYDSKNTKKGNSSLKKEKESINSLNKKFIISGKKYLTSSIKTKHSFEYLKENLISSLDIKVRKQYINNNYNKKKYLIIEIISVYQGNYLYSKDIKKQKTRSTNNNESLLHIKDQIKIISKRKYLKDFDEIIIFWNNYLPILVKEEKIKKWKKYFKLEKEFHKMGEDFFLDTLMFGSQKI